MATASYDPHLGSGPSEDSEILLDDSDSGSVLSDDSVLPDYEAQDGHAQPAKTLYEACLRNDPAALRRILTRGVTRDEAMELDINGRVRRAPGATFTATAGRTAVQHPTLPFTLPRSFAEWTDGGCGKGFRRHRLRAARLSADRHQPSRQRRQHGPHDCRPSRLVQPRPRGQSLCPQLATPRNTTLLISPSRLHYHSELHCQLLRGCGHGGQGPPWLHSPHQGGSAGPRGVRVCTANAR